MRVIAGKYRSRRLRSLAGLDLRPTSDRLRETLFDVLSAGQPTALEGSLWIDLYAGTGAVGIEALSRGAGMVYFVESSRQGAALIRRNLQSLGLESGFEVLEKNSERALAELEARAAQADFVFLDPPYRMQAECRALLSAIAGSRLLNPNPTVIAEHARKFDPGAVFGALARYRKLEQGGSTLSFYRKIEASHPRFAG
ncbi:MAG TPA: 16S rRNA (guanine(966)-N(2))-methyltransferase RsmD [Terriglobales bacterium]|nr:16S rRNA (guanine(966)-N(2))-methyltransferase RsmD [Terriglobales bacterium]